MNSRRDVTLFSHPKYIRKRKFIPMDKHQDEISSGSRGFHNYCREVETQVKNNSNGAHSMIPIYILFTYYYSSNFQKGLNSKNYRYFAFPGTLNIDGNGGIYAEHLSFTVPGDCNPGRRRLRVNKTMS